MKSRLLNIIIFFVLLTCSAYVQSAQNLTIHEKIDANISKYADAEELLLNNHKAGVITTRSTLNDILIPEAKYVLNTKDLKELRRRHASLALDTYEKNKEECIFDISSISDNQQLLKQFMIELPKGGMLHVHPSGTRNMRTVRDILERVNPVININDDILGKVTKQYSYLYPDEINIIKQFPQTKQFNQYNDYQKNYLINLFALPQDGKAHPSPRFSAIFKLGKLLNKSEDFETRNWVKGKTYDDFIKRASRHNVSYVEFTKGFKYSNDIKQFEWWAKKWEKMYQITARWNMAYVRLRSNQDNADSFDKFKTNFQLTPSAYLTGIDFLADETDAPALEKGQSLYIKAYLFNNQENVTLHRTMHAGERGHPHNPRDAILLKSERLGHAVKLYDDPLTLEYIRIHQIPLVANLISNIQLGAAADIATHPFLHYLRLGIPVSLSTDDEGMFNSDISLDFLKAVNNTNINYNELKQLAYNSIESCFSSPDKKAELLQDLDKRFEYFENKWIKVLNNTEKKVAVLP